MAAIAKCDRVATFAALAADEHQFGAGWKPPLVDLRETQLRRAMYGARKWHRAGIFSVNSILYKGDLKRPKTAARESLVIGQA